MNVYKIELLVIDFDSIGPDDVRDEIENTRYANNCMSPHVMTIETRQIEWSDQHPLNLRDTTEDEFRRLFGS